MKCKKQKSTLLVFKGLLFLMYMVHMLSEIYIHVQSLGPNLVVI